jgi:C_GCAxxG_C_C family probable redox protein
MEVFDDLIIVDVESLKNFGGRRCVMGNESIVKNPAAEMAKNNFIYGYHCSESVVKAINDYYELNLDDSILKMVSAFAAGMGKAKCACGCITGGVIVLGYLYGRTESHEDDDLIADLAKELHDKFIAEFNVACCKELTKDVKWGHPDHRVKCSEYVYSAARNLSEILEETQRNMPIENGIHLH